jgi:hypothetical protein
MADPRDELVDPILSNEPGFMPPREPPREPLRIRVSPYDTPPPVVDPGKGAFNPEGTDYDYAGAAAAGITPDATGHWATRDPNTGLILKGTGHETFGKTIAGEDAAGYEIIKRGDRYYSSPKGGWGAPDQETGRPAARLFEPDQAPPEPKPQWQPGILSAVPIARGIGSLVQGAKDWFSQPATASTASSDAVALPAARDPTAGPRQMFQQGYPSAPYSSMFKGPAEAVGHVATEVLQEPYNLVRAGQDIASPGATDQQVQQARQQEAAAATNLTSNMIGANAPFAAARPATAGVFGGRLAKGFDPNKERLAELMHQNGVPAPQIWKETGMVKFADGKWAHEISDLGAYYKGDVDSITKSIFDQKYPDRAGQYDANPLRMNISRNDALLKLQGKQQLYLPDVLHHPELFQKYPELLKMPVSEDAFMNARGGYLPHSVAGTDVRPAEIKYREEYQPGKMARGATFDTLLHEIQHAIQQIEGFAKGASPDYFAPGSKADKIYQDMMSQMPPGLSQQRQNQFEQYARVHAGNEGYTKSPGENLANLAIERKDLTPEQASAINPPSQFRVPLEQQKDFVEYNRITNPQGTAPQRMGGILRPTMHEGPQMSAGPTPFLRPGRTMKEENWQPTKPTVLDPRRVFSPEIYRNPRLIAERAAENVAAEHPALKELFGVTRADLYDISQQGRRKGNMEPEIFAPKKPGESYVAEGLATPQNEQRILDTLGEGLKHRGLREGMVPWYVMDPMFQHMVKLVGKEQAIQDYKRFNATTAPFSASSDVMTELNRGTAAHMYAKRGDYETFHRFAGADRKNLPPGFPADMSDVGGHAYHAIQSDPVVRWLATGKHGYGQQIVKIPTYHAASGVPETGFQTRWPVPDAHFARGVGAADVRDTAKPGVSMKGAEYRSMAPWYREKIAEPLGIEAVPAQALQWGTMSRATGVDTPIGAGKLELLAQRIWERAHKLGVDPKELRDAVLRGDQHAVGLLTAGAGGAAGIGSLVAPNRQEVY